VPSSRVVDQGVVDDGLIISLLDADATADADGDEDDGDEWGVVSDAAMVDAFAS